MFLGLNVAYFLSVNGTRKGRRRKTRELAERLFAMLLLQGNITIRSTGIFVSSLVLLFLPFVVPFAICSI